MDTNHEPLGSAPNEPDADEMSLAWEWRVLAVAVAGAFPGVLFAAVLGLFLPRSCFEFGLVAGGMLGALAGGLLEADHLI
jgi:hypothetical protein